MHALVSHTAVAAWRVCHVCISTAVEHGDRVINKPSFFVNEKHKRGLFMHYLAFMIARLSRRRNPDVPVRPRCGATPNF